MKQIYLLLFLLITSISIKAQCSFTTSIAASGPTVACGNVTLTAGSTGTSYAWSNGGTTQAITATVSGTYSVFITNASGCTATAVQSLSLSSNPTIIVNGGNSICSGFSATLIASGALSYTWSANAGGSNSNSIIVSPTSSIIYTVSGTTGSCTVDYQFTLNVNPTPTLSISASGPTLACGNVTLNALNSGNTWTQKTSLNLGRQAPIAFSIGNKGYVGLGFNSVSSTSQLGDLWEYDPSANAWTQKANFGGTARWGAVAFVIGSNAYVGTGYDVIGNYKNDFWEYNPQTNAWVQKANFAGVGRTNASGFAVNNKGYIGTGHGSSISSPLNDFWEYNPTSNTWTQKANLAGGARYGTTGFNLGSKGYFCGGIGGPSIYIDLWEYDPTLNTWTQKANFGGGNRIYAAAFTIGTKAYVGTGNSGGSPQTLFNDLWEYDQTNNIWLQKSSFPGIGRSSARGFAINGIGYLCAGAGGTVTPDLNDLWQYHPSNSINWSTGSTLQTITASTSGNYSVTVTSPAGCSVSASQSLAISPNPTLSVTIPSLVCSGSTYTIIASGANTYTWSANAGGGNSVSNIITPTSNLYYTVSGTTGSCSVDFPISINVNPIPSIGIGISASGPTVGCGSLTLSANGIGNVWAQKAGLNTGRQGAVAFSIGNKGYLGTGHNGSTNTFLNDFWEYDPILNTWSQKANFGGGARVNAVGFAIGTKGYIGTGLDNNNTNRNDFWEYNPSLNTWTQKANLAGVARYSATCFTIGGKAYVGTGFSSIYLADFWEYDSSTDTWTQKANFAGLARDKAVSFSIGSKGYVGTGYNTTYPYYYKDFWEYNPSSNTWTQKADLAGPERRGAVGFGIGSKGYVGTGSGNLFYNDLWEYNANNNTWVQQAAFPGVFRANGIAFVVLGSGHIGTGLGQSAWLSDIFQFVPTNTINWSTSSTSPSISVSNFANYSLTLTNPYGCSATINQSVAITPYPIISITGNSIPFCIGSTSTLTALGATSYTWSANAGGLVSNSVIVSPTSSIVYTVSGTTGMCSSNYVLPLNVNPLPTAPISASGPTLTCGSVTLSTFSSGNSWAQKAGLNTGRSSGVAFSIGNKAYLGTGINGSTYYNDFWEYDPNINSWTQKANFGGTARQQAVGFSILNKGYVGTGYNGSIAPYFFNDFWEYDQSANTWTQKANYAGGARIAATGFAIDNKGYLGTGFYSSTYFNDFWEYDPSINSWTQKAALSGNGRYAAVGFNINNKGYIATGYNANISPNSFNDLWEYNPSLNNWVQKASLTGIARSYAAGFSIGNYGYLGTGQDQSGNKLNDFWEYNQTNNSWTQRTNLGGVTRLGACGFAISGKGYFAIGNTTSTPTFLSDLWQFDPSLSVQWSTGSTLQTIPISASGNYSLTITNNWGCSATSSQSILLSPNPTITISGYSVQCEGQSNTLTATGANNYTWSSNAGGGNSNSVIVTPIVTTIYTVSGTTGSCTVNYPITIDVNPLPNTSISVSGPTLNCGSLTLSANGIGNTWTQKTGLSTARQGAVAFSIGGKGYIGTGYNGTTNTYLNDFWEYNPALNSWTQKANFGGVARQYAIGFSIGTKGYTGTGYNGSNLNDFWEYDPITNFWTQKANFAGVARRMATCFTIGAKGYVGTGLSTGYQNDFWEYDPLINNWTQKANFGGAARYQAVGFSIGLKGYVGTGYNGNNSFASCTDFWEFDPTLNTWLQKAYFPSSSRQGAIGFALGSKAYVGLGNSYSNSTLMTDFWEYDPNLNTWVQRASFLGASRWNAIAFVISGSAYVGTGVSGFVYMNDMWQFNPLNSLNWSTSSTLQSISVSNTGNYSLTLTNNYGCSATNTQSVALSPNPTVNISGNSLIHCIGSTSTLSATGASGYTWSANAGGVNTNTVAVNPTVTTVYSVAAASGSCIIDFPVHVYVGSATGVNIVTAGSSTTCGSSLSLSTSIASANVWTQKTSINTGRRQAAAFSIGNKGYIGTGTGTTVHMNDFWEYDPNTNAWTQKANFGGSARYGAVGFSIGNKGYIGTGNNNNISPYVFNDFWEYDPTANTWTQKANVGGPGRFSAVAFTLNDKGYIGTGFNGSPLSDFWEYNPLTNIWVQKANFGGSARYWASGFSVVGKGYVGTGNNGISILSDFWEYDPNTNVWTQKANFGGAPRLGVSGFGIGNKGYLGTGSSSTDYNDFWEYDPSLNTWTQKPSIGASGRTAGIAFVINSKGYLGTGSNGSTYLNTFWEYDPQINYLWSTGSTLQAITATVSGTYSLTLNNVYGCNSSTTQVVGVALAPIVSISGPSVSCVGSSFSLTANGANNYTWSANAGNANTGTVSVSPSGSTTYSVIGSSNGCTVSLNYPVVVNNLPTVVANASSLSVCNGNSVSLYGSGAISYSWSSGIINNTAFTPSVTNTYTVSGTDINACTNTAVITITVNAIPSIGVNSGTICQGQSFTMIPNGASTYTYSSGSAVVAPMVNNSYSVVGTSSAGCISSAAAIATVDVLASPTLAVSGGSICNGQSFTLSPTGAVTYSYSGGNAIVSPNTTTSYTVTGTNANGCTNYITAIAAIAVYSLPSISAPSGSICAGASFTINPSGALSYTYSSGSNVVTPASTSSYSVYGTNAAGCVNLIPAALNVTVNATPVIGVNSGTICQGQSFTLIPNGASTYTYSSGSAIVSPMSDNNYSVVGTSSAGCVGAAAAIATVNVLASPTLAVSGGSICNGLSFTLTPTGAVTYSYSGGNAVVSPNTTTSYTVTGANANGCTNYIPAIAAITVYTLPSISAPSGSICAGNAFTINPTGALSYTYSSGSNVVTPASTSSYSVYGTNAAGCVNLIPAVLTVTVHTIPVIGVNNGTICQGQSFTLIPNGANTYTYSSGSTIVSPMSNNNYSVVGTSSAGCLSASAAIATVNVLASPTLAVSGGSICNGQSFTLTPTGAVTYSYSGGNAIVSPNTTTSYTVTGTNANGCTNYIPAIAAITVYSLPSISAPSGTICAGASFTINPSGALSYTYSSGSNVVTPASTSSYSVYGTNAASCVNSIPAVLTVTVHTIPVIGVNSGTICQSQSFTLIPNGASTYTYSSGSAIVSPMSNNNYSVVGTSSAGCLSAAAAIATVNVLASPTLAVSGGSICSGQNFTLSPSGALSYTYSNGNAVVSPNTTTSYTVTGTNANGCTNYIPAIAAITVYSLPSISAPSGTICAGASFTINPSGALSYTYSSGSNVVTPASTSSYSVYGTNAAGCVNLIPAALNVTVNATPVIGVNSGTICQGQSFTLIPNGASTYTYSSGSAVVSPMSNNNYSVVGTSSAGCVSTTSALASVTVFAAPVVSAISGSICAGNSFTIIPNGATSYTYSNGSNVVSPITNTTYSVSGSNTLGCVSLSPAVITVSVNALPLISANGGTVCSGNSFTINPSGANSYTYSSGSNVVTPNVTTGYSITGSNANGCINTTAVVIQVSVVANPTISMPNTAIICYGESYTITPNGAITYTYSGGSNIVNPNSTTSYTVNGSSPEGCIGSAVISVSVQPSLTVSISGATATCDGQAIILTSNGANTYTWSNGSNNNTIAISPTSTTVYSVNANSGACSTTVTHLVLVFPKPTIILLLSDTIICEGESTTLTASGANSYTWNTGITGSLAIINPSTTTTFSIIGLDTNSCYNNASITQSVDACLGMLQHDYQTKIQIYPNPNNGKLFIKFETEMINAKIEIYNYLGQLILSKPCSSLHEEIEIKDVANGVYTIRILEKGETKLISKVIKQ